MSTGYKFSRFANRLDTGIQILGLLPTLLLTTIKWKDALIVDKEDFIRNGYPPCPTKPNPAAFSHLASPDV